MPLVPDYDPYNLRTPFRTYIISTLSLANQDAVIGKHFFILTMRFPYVYCFGTIEGTTDVPANGPCAK